MNWIAVHIVYALLISVFGQECTDTDTAGSLSHESEIVTADHTFILAGYTVPCNGTVVAWEFCYRKSDAISVTFYPGIWRINGTTGIMNYVLVQSNNITYDQSIKTNGTSNDQCQRVNLSVTDQFTASAESVVGLYSGTETQLLRTKNKGSKTYRIRGNQTTVTNQERKKYYIAIRAHFVEPSSETQTGSEDSSSSSVGGIVAGCVVGVVVCVVIVVLLILLLVWYQRRKGKNEGTQDHSTNSKRRESENNNNGLGNLEHSSADHRTNATTIKDEMADNRTADNPGYCSTLHDNSETVYSEPTKTNVSVHRKATSNVYTNTKASSGDYMAIHKYDTPQQSHVPLYYEVVVPSTNGDNAEYSTVGEPLPPNEQLYEDPGHKKEKIYAWFEKKKFRILDRNDIKVSQELGYGEFGMVNLGSWSNGSTDPVQVAVKTLNSECSESDIVKFLREAAIMGQFAHNNVVKLYGVVTEEENMMIVLEYMPNGDLRDLLINLKIQTLPEAYNTLKNDLLSFCRQIAAGMSYLAKKQFVHRDLAARNILVSSDDVCKIADFGMARDVADDTYYITSGGKIPLKWTALEAILYKKYSIQSDVWSFGCIMYEIWSLACKPYEDLDGKEYVQKITTGYRLPPPPGCPRAIYELMIQCWNPNARDRPVAGSVSETLQKSDRALLTSSVQDNITKDNQSMMLGAPLSAGSQLYLDLQQRYTTKSS